MGVMGIIDISNRGTQTVLLIIFAAAWCFYQWGRAAGVASTTEASQNALKAAARAEQHAREAHTRISTVVQRIDDVEGLAKRADGKTESAHAKADRVERESLERDAEITNDTLQRMHETVQPLRDRLARLEGDQQDGGS